jgi:putative membrane protein insertion efficiency factor
MKFVDEALRAVERALSFVLLLAIRAYQTVHIAFFRGSCRFHPTCSHYALEAIQLHGAGRGSLLAAWRVLRCQPFCRGGFDPVPEPKLKNSRAANAHKQFRSQRLGVLVAGKHETH